MCRLQNPLCLVGIESDLLQAHIICGNHTGPLFTQGAKQSGEMPSPFKGCSVEAALQMSPTTWVRGDGEGEQFHPSRSEEPLPLCLQADRSQRAWLPVLLPISHSRIEKAQHKPALGGERQLCPWAALVACILSALAGNSVLGQKASLGPRLCDFYFTLFKFSVFTPLLSRNPYKERSSMQGTWYTIHYQHKAAACVFSVEPKNV